MYLIDAVVAETVRRHPEEYRDLFTARAGKVDIKVEKTAVNVIDAAAQGAGDGLHLALNIGGMLIAFLALIAMVNGVLGWVHTLPAMGWLPESLQKIFGVLFAPISHDRPLHIGRQGIVVVAEDGRAMVAGADDR